MHKNQKRFFLIIVGIVVLFLLIIGGICLFISSQLTTSENQVSENQVINQDQQLSQNQNQTNQNIEEQSTFSKMTNEEAKVLFKATEIVSNNLPNSIEFWTEADCPLTSKWGYTIPNGYELLMEDNNCLTGEKGSHGGCTTCVMSKIKLAGKNQQRNNDPLLKSIISSDYVLLKSIPFNLTPVEFVNIYSECVDQGLDSCYRKGLVLIKYNSKDKSNTMIGRIDWLFGASSGGLFIPVAITKDDKKLILSAKMGSPGAGGGGVDYGFALVYIPDGESNKLLIESKDNYNYIGPQSAIFYDYSSKIVYVGESKNSPQFSSGGPSNNGKIVCVDLIKNESTILLEENYTSYRIIKLDEKNDILEIEATKYTIPEGCDPEIRDLGYAIFWDASYFSAIPSCVIKTIITKTIDLP